MAKKEKMSEEEKGTNRENRSLRTKFKNEVFDLGLHCAETRLEYLKTHPNPSLPKMKYLTKEQIIEACELGIKDYHEEKHFA